MKYEMLIITRPDDTYEYVRPDMINRIRDRRDGEDLSDKCRSIVHLASGETIPSCDPASELVERLENTIGVWDGGVEADEPENH